jgi:hypothetical protein
LNRPAGRASTATKSSPRKSTESATLKIGDGLALPVLKAVTCCAGTYTKEDRSENEVTGILL